MKILSWIPSDFVVWVYTVFFRSKHARSLIQSVVKLFIPNETLCHGVVVCLNKNDAIVSGALTFGCYENEFYHEIEKFIHPEVKFLDIGANIGLYSAVIAKKAGSKARVIAVEPSPENCEYIRKTIKRNELNNVVVENCALGHESGKVKLYLNDLNKADHRVYDLTNQRDFVEIDMRTGDEILSRSGWNQVDLIKIDTQGYEKYVVDGLETTFNNAQSLTVFMEFWPWGLRQAQSDPSELLKKIKSHKFSISLVGSKLDESDVLSMVDSLILRNLEREHINLILRK
jgi:FkbM family methyltransferase